MPKTINQHGGVLQQTTGLHGADIASQRMDQLDWDCIADSIERLKSGSELNVIDLGAGYGAQSLRLAALGASVWMYDLLDREEFSNSVNALVGRERLLCVRADLRKLEPEAFPSRVHIAYSQRFIHYLPFADALALLRVVGDRMPQGSNLYLSASGLNSELGIGYSAANQEVQQRFSVLEPGMAEKHQIIEPVCLYTEADLSYLAELAGFAVLSVSRSAFGNIKGVFKRPA